MNSYDWKAGLPHVVVAAHCQSYYWTSHRDCKLQSKPATHDLSPQLPPDKIYLPKVQPCLGPARTLPVRTSLPPSVYNLELGQLWQIGV
jgi:hypothetical protein